MDAQVPELNIRDLAAFAATDPALMKADATVVKAGVVRPGIDANGFDLPPPESDAATASAPPPPKPPLNRDPGHLIPHDLFKLHDQPVIDPNVVPPGGP